MKTELNIANAQVLPGRKINMIAYNVANHNVHNILKPVSRLLIWMLEADTNNTTRTVDPLEVQNVWLALEYINSVDRDWETSVR